MVPVSGFLSMALTGKYLSGARRMLRRALRLRRDALVVRIRMFRGQTTAEYALVLVAVAIVVLVAYEVMGQEISNTVAVVNTTLASAPGH
jgi:Flp pilus assembly pilin Flp